VKVALALLALKIDVNGALMLHIKTKADDTAEVLDARGKAQPLL
jgi:hypothetical protein